MYGMSSMGYGGSGLMRPRLAGAIAISAMLAFVASPAIAEVYTVASVIPFAEDSGATAEQKSECMLDTRLPIYLAAVAEPGIEIVISTKPLDEVVGKVLRLEIVRANDRSGGMVYRRPARLAVRGELLENGEAIGSFLVMRQTVKTAKFDGFKGACAMLGRCLDLLSRDIAIWLQNPTIDARLGEI